jgi:hypothetical protein
MNTQDIALVLRTVLFFAASLAFSVEGLAQNAPLIGIDSNYGLDMATRGKTWKDRSAPIDPYKLFSINGCQNARPRLWVGEDGTVSTSAGEPFNFSRRASTNKNHRRLDSVGLRPPRDSEIGCAGRLLLTAISWLILRRQATHR